jgi:hypothetical protein
VGESCDRRINPRPIAGDYQDLGAIFQCRLGDRVSNTRRSADDDYSFFAEAHVTPDWFVNGARASLTAEV